MEPKLKPYSNNLVPTPPMQRTTGRATRGWEKPEQEALVSSLFPELRFSVQRGRKEWDRKEDKEAVILVTCPLRTPLCVGNSLLARPVPFLWASASSKQPEEVRQKTCSANWPSIVIRTLRIKHGINSQNMSQMWENAFPVIWFQLQ